MGEGMKGAFVNRIAVLPLVLIILSVVIPVRSNAQVFYQYPEAPLVKAGEVATGPYIAFGKDEAFRIGGYGRMNATTYFDVGAEILLGSQDGDGLWGGGVDIRFSPFPPSMSIPFDLAVTAGAGAVTGDVATIVQIPIGGAISSPFTMNNGSQLVPYLGVYMLFVDTNIKLENVPDDSDIDLDAELRGGAKYTLASGPEIFAALHLGRDWMVTVGMNFWPKGRN